MLENNKIEENLDICIKKKILDIKMDLNYKVVKEVMLLHQLLAIKVIEKIYEVIEYFKKI